MNDLLTVNELAEFLRVSRRTAYMLVKESKVPAVKIGGVWRIPRSELERQLGIRNS